MTYRLTALLFLIAVLFTAPALVILLSIGLPRFPWLFIPASLLLFTIFAISFLLPLSGWISRTIVVAIPLLIFALPSGFIPSYVFPSVFMTGVAIHLAFLTAGRPNLAKPIEPVLWGLFLTFLTLSYFLGPILQLYIWGIGLGWESRPFLIGIEDAVFIGVFVLPVCLSVTLRFLIERAQANSHKSLKFAPALSGLRRAR